MARDMTKYIVLAHYSSADEILFSAASDGTLHVDSSTGSNAFWLGYDVYNVYLYDVENRQIVIEQPIASFETEHDLEQWINEQGVTS